MPKKKKGIIQSVKDYFELHKEWRSILNTAITIFLVDATFQLQQLYDGDITTMLLHSLFVIFGRSLLKAFLQYVFPTTFNKK